MLLSKDNDLLLIEKSKRGDISAFEALVLKYQDRVYNICRYMLGASDAEDAAQDVFIKIYKNLANFNPSPSFSAWMSRIAINTCIDYKRKPYFQERNHLFGFFLIIIFDKIPHVCLNLLTKG